MELVRKTLVLALSLGVIVYLVPAVLSGLADPRNAFAGFR
jgi:hypothetical protein